MNTLMNRIALAAAGALVLATAAFSQSTVMKIDIPFDFSTTNAKLPAGQYIVRHVSSAHAAAVESLSSVATGRSIYVMGRERDTYKQGPAALLFRCNGSDCSLAAIRTSNGTTNFSEPSKSKGTQEALVVIPVNTAKAD